MYEQLEKWGFQLRHEIIDYSYDRHSHPYERAKAMVEELKRLNDTYTPEELAELTRQLDIIIKDCVCSYLENLSGTLKN